MKFTFEGNSIDGGQNGLTIAGILPDETIIRENQFRGVSDTAVKIELASSWRAKLGLPEDTDPREIADVLVLLSQIPREHRQDTAQRHPVFKKWIKGGMDGTSLLANIMTIVSALP